jgi:hypothetical protein
MPVWQNYTARSANTPTRASPQRRLPEGTPINHETSENAMKTLQTQSVLGLSLLLALVFSSNTALGAQTAEFQLVPSNAVPQAATFVSIQFSNLPPIPWNPYPQLNVYSLSEAPGWYWVDDRAVDYGALRQQRQMNRALRSMESQYGLDSPDDAPPGPGGWEGSGGDDPGPPAASPAYFYPSNSFWLEPVSVASNLFNVILHGTTNGSTYLITSTEALNPQTNSIWLVEGSLQGGTNDATPFALGIATRTNKLFIRAQVCDPSCASTVLPLAWQLDYFGVTGVDPGGLDPLGYSFLDDWLNDRDPNVVQFSLFVAQQYVNSSPVSVQLNIAGGVPSFIVVLINNDTNVSWQPLTSTNLSVATPTNGTYVITVGLCGMATNATQTWQSVTVVRDSTPLTLTLTNLAARSGSRPFIDPAGYATRALKAITWTVVDASGGTSSGSATVVAQGWNLLDRYHTTNWFQCLDLALAPGTNWVSIQAVDWAGNVAATNFPYVFDTSGDITPPALTLLWPQNGAQVSGDSFTVQAGTDDDTAAVALQYTGGSGTLQTVNGLVERGGNVWVQDVPLAAGTNGFSMVATDAAGNMSTNSFAVVQSSVALTINPLSQDQMKYGYATVTGAVDDPNCGISVNGVTGTNYGNGTWEVDNVPLPPGGTIALQATAQLPGGATAQTLWQGVRDPIVFTQTYDYQLNWLRGGDGYSAAWGWGVQWARGAGGTSWQTITEVSTNQGVVLSNAWLTVAVWPPDNGYVPSLPGQVVSSSYCNGVFTGSFTIGVDPPAKPGWTQWTVEWMEQCANVAPCPENYDGTCSQWSGREVRLFTGGRATRRSQGLFDLSAALTVESEFDPDSLGWGLIGGFFDSAMSPATPPVVEPSQQISLGALGNLGSDAHLWAVESDGQEVVVTEMAPEPSYEGPLPNQKKYKLLINWDNGAGDITDTNATAVVGQRISLSCGLAPDGGPPVTNYQWTIPGYAVSNYTADAYSAKVWTNFLTTTNSVQYYWVDGGLKQVSCTATAGGFAFTAETTFNVLRPDATWILTPKSHVAVDTNYYGGIPGWCYLHTGVGHTTNDVGMLYEYHATDLKGYSRTYNFSFVQIASFDWKINLDLGLPGTNVASKCLAGRGLDNGELGLNGRPAADYWYERWFFSSGYADDTPSDWLMSAYYFDWRRDNFECYLLFQPDGGIPVPIKLATWNWYGRAQKVDTNVPPRFVGVLTYNFFWYPMP